MAATSAKTIGWRLLRLGRVPRRARVALEAEGLRLLEEGIRATLTYRCVRAPGRRIRWRRQIHSAALVLTSQRLAAFVGWGRLLDVRLDDPRMHTLSFEATPEHFVVDVDLAALDARRSGSLRCRFRTPNARMLQSWLGSDLPAEARRTT